MKNAFIRKKVTYLSLILRVLLGALILPTGFQMVTHYYSTLAWLTEGVMHLPLFIAYSIIVITFYASLFLIAGFGSRIMAGALGLLLVAAIPYQGLVQSATDWIGQEVSPNLAFHLPALGFAIILMFTGSGKLSLDRAIEQLMCREKLKTCTND